MKIKKIIFSLMVLVVGMLNVGGDFDEYQKLENKKAPLIKKDDLPQEFGDGAFDTIVDFIEKTRDLDNEWVIYFDYVTSKILKCGNGSGDKVSVNFEDGEFEGHHVASLHNHPQEVLSPPSSKNFGILERNFEDYELIAGFEYFWILKAKGIHKNLVGDFNNASDVAYALSFLFCTRRYGNGCVFNRMQDLRYGGELLNYINGKNINDVELNRLRYVNMNNSKTAIYDSKKRITNPEVIKFARDFECNPFTPNAKDMMYAFYQRMGRYLFQR